MSNMINDLIDNLLENGQEKARQKVIDRIVYGLSDGSATTANIFHLLETVIKIDNRTLFGDTGVFLFALAKQPAWLAGLNKGDRERLVNIIVFKTEFGTIPDTFVEMLRPYIEIVINAVDKTPPGKMLYASRTFAQELVGFGKEANVDSIKKRNLSDVVPIPIVEILTSSQHEILLGALATAIRVKLTTPPISQDDRVFLSNLIQMFVDKRNIEGLEMLLAELGRKNFDLGNKLRVLGLDTGKNIAHTMSRIFKMQEAPANLKKRIADLLTKVPEFTYDMFREESDLLRSFLEYLK